MNQYALVGGVKRCYRRQSIFFHSTVQRGLIRHVPKLFGDNLWIKICRIGEPTSVWNFHTSKFFCLNSSNENSMVGKNKF